METIKTLNFIVLIISIVSAIVALIVAISSGSVLLGLVASGATICSALLIFYAVQLLTIIEEEIHELKQLVNHLISEKRD